VDLTVVRYAGALRRGSSRFCSPISRRVDRGSKPSSGVSAAKRPQRAERRGIFKKRFKRALAQPQRRDGRTAREPQRQRPDVGRRHKETTYAFPAHLLGELDAPAAEGVEPRVSAVEGPPSRSALLLVMRGPNAGTQFLLDQPVTSAGRHPDSDIFLDHITVSRRHVEFRLENGQFRLVDLDSLNGTYVNREPVDSAVLVDGDEIQIGKFRLVFLPGPTTS